MTAREILEACAHHDLAPAANRITEDGAPCWECALRAVEAAREEAVDSLANYFKTASVTVTMHMGAVPGQQHTIHVGDALVELIRARRSP